MQKICEAITERSLVGELRRRCQTLEKGQERDKERFNSLRKQVCLCFHTRLFKVMNSVYQLIIYTSSYLFQMTELNIVMKKYLDNQKNHVPQPPLKVTRSVGLQVCQAIKPVSEVFTLLGTSSPFSLLRESS